MTTTPLSGPGQVLPGTLPAVFPSADTWQPWATERGLRCINCQRTYALREVIYRCPACNDLLDVVYPRPEHDLDALKRRWRRRRGSDRLIDRSGVWRFRELLPFYDHERQLITYPEGNTPLLDAPRSAAYAGVRRIRFKHLGFNPTGSFKDYGMVAGVTQARILGMRAVACASTGNTSASMAAYAARAGLSAIVLVPEGGDLLRQARPDAGLRRPHPPGAGRLRPALALLQPIAPDAGDLHPQLGQPLPPGRAEDGHGRSCWSSATGRPPTASWCPAATWATAASTARPCASCTTWGCSPGAPTSPSSRPAAPPPSTTPSSAAAPGDYWSGYHARTLATAIKIGDPVSWKKARRAVDWSDGWVTSVEEQEIADAKAVIGADGIGCEPASATTLAAIRRLAAEGTDARVDPDEDIVAILTGNVLKDADYTLRYHSSELYEEFTTETTLSPKGPKLELHFANPPVVVDASAEALTEAVRAHLRSRP